MSVPTIFSRFLAGMGVPHTDTYSDRQFRAMTFKSLYGLSHLLSTYGIKNEGLEFADKSEMTQLDTPFLAQTKSGAFVIVTDVDSAGGTVRYDSRGESFTVSHACFIKAWNGVALLAFPTKNSREPGYASHRFTEIISSLSKYALAAAAILVFAYFFITRHMYDNAATVLLTIFDFVGLYFSFLLLQKSLDIHTAASERVCGILEHGGCDSVMQLKVSKLFGVFSWSEVGFGYFGVSLVTLLLFPHLLPQLALCNVCCLPYTVWSIWYQRFRAHHWCTLCVGVQATLWALFFCYLGGGWLRQSFPLHPDFFTLIAVYVFAVLLINYILRIFKNLPTHEKDTGT
ncbi:MAG: vitamin K epoxide reductase family protein [Muribaculum sp.]|nr:vitamin K epoxide reductase family protein [Muribaculum sp.]